MTDDQITLEILSGSYRENQNYAKELYSIKSRKTEKQWKAAREILEELNNFKRTLTKI